MEYIISDWTSSNINHLTDATLAPTMSASNSNNPGVASRANSIYGDGGGGGGGSISINERNLSSTSLNTKTQIVSNILPPISVIGNSGNSGSASQPSTPRSTHYELLRELVHKRIATLIYFKRLYEGRSFYLNTMIITPELLHTNSPYVNDDIAPGKRAYMFYVLGTSLGPLLELTNSTYYAKALYTLVQEYDTFSTEVIKSKRGRMNLRKIRIPGDNNNSSNSSNSNSNTNGFNSTIYNNQHINPSNSTTNSNNSNNSNNSGNRFDLNDLDTTEYTRLELQPVPFELDYAQTLYSLCDMMSEVYGKLLDSSCDQSFWELVLKLDVRLKFAAIDPLLANVDSIINTDEYVANDASSIYSL
ncbi:hypothetical protein BDF22DRAFT_676760 [Syncephalis plumigaleata]|nr:hypothetical protein BDF22DRAFT_676760 [Syncephalis plumigaleata]